MSTWATKADLVLRYGQEYIEKAALRRDFNEDADDYVADESCDRINEVICAALEDAKEWLLWKISCSFNLADFNNLDDINYIKIFHMRLTIAMLKEGGDCEKCQKEFSEFCACGQICDINGKCITKTKISLIAVEQMPKSCLPQNVCCGCLPNRCDCGKA